MSKPIAPRFLPWLRTGLAAHIAERAKDGMAPGDQATVAVAVRLRAAGTSDFAAQVTGPAIRLRGPGEVVAIDQALVLRRDPEPGTNDAEDNYLVMIELSASDLPWRYTPAATTSGRLQPWIALVVVEEREGVRLETGSAGHLPVLHIDDVARELPDLRQSWAWAHVQADRELGDLAAALAAAPEAFRSRLLCPRRLLPRRAWLACVVPTFEAGRRAGLGEPVTPNMGLAWDRAARGELRLPVYHSWRFQTGPGGDFEALVGRLRACELPAGVGRRDLDISDPGGGLPAVKGAVITYQGALVAPAGADTARPWPAEQRRRMKSALQAGASQVLAAAKPPAPYDARRDDPVVGPPAYAALQARRRAVPSEGEPPLWFGELNSEPQHRAAAALGAAVVRQDQERLMALAWKHAAGVVEANRLLNRARTALEVARHAKRRMDALPDEELVQVAGPAMARLRHAPGQTVKGAVAASALPPALLSGAFRRVSHTAPGFVTVTAEERRAPTATITRAALSPDMERFVGRWADVRSPAGADVDGAPKPASTARTAESSGATTTELRRAQCVVTPYSGDVAPVRSLAASTRAALDPLGTIARMVNARVKGLPEQQAREVPARTFVRPVFTNPMYRRLVALSVEYLVPGIGAIPEHSVGLLVTNPPFIEAFLAGLNHELWREFVWREYPARPEGTWAQHFWDSGPQVGPAIVPIRSWKETARLGSNGPEGAAQPKLVLLIKSPVLRRYPDLRVYAVKAAWSKDKDGRDVRREAEPPAADVRAPLFVARLTPDTAVYGFDLAEQAARGSTKPPAHPGYFFVLEQQPGSPRFGLDAGRPEHAGAAPQAWRGLSWQHLARQGAQPAAFIDVAGPPWLKAAGALPSNSDAPADAGNDPWGDDAAAMARITYQRPVRMLIHADAMLPAAKEKR